MTNSNVTNRYKVKDDSVCTLCEEQAVWYERPCNDDHKYFMCNTCMVHCTYEGEQIVFNDEDSFEKEESEHFKDTENDTEANPDEDSDLTDQFSVGSFTISEYGGFEWRFAKGICSLGGCGTEIVIFSNRHEVIEEAERLTNEEFQPKVGYPCTSCLREYYS